jgi:2-dehydro-3-deoxygluconokinase
MKNKIITFGEIMLRLSTPNNARFTQTQSYLATYGGSDANVGASLAVLGIAAGIVTTFPNNDIGQAATESYKKVGVDTSKINFEGKRIGIYYVENGAAMRPSKVIYDRADSAFALAAPKTYDWATILKEATWFHFTGITPALSENTAKACLEAAKMAKSMGLKVSADVGYRSNLWQWGKKPIEIMPALVELCDIIVCSKSDAKDMLEVNSDELNPNFASFCKIIMARFPNLNKIINTKRGQLSASHNTLIGQCYSNGKLLKTKEIDIPNIVDRIGGGDAFMAGFIFGQMKEYSDQKSLDFAVAASALKHTIEGDINLATEAEIELILKGDTSGKLRR